MDRKVIIVILLVTAGYFLLRPQQPGAATSKKNTNDIVSGVLPPAYDPKEAADGLKKIFKFFSDIPTIVKRWAPTPPPEAEKAISAEEPEPYANYGYI